jgi:hypothetical protein
MYTGRHPFHHLPTDPSVCYHVITGGQHKRPDESQCFFDMSDFIWTMIQTCCDRHPSRRPSMAEVHEKLLRIANSKRASDNQVPKVSTDKPLHLERVRFSTNISPGSPSPLVRREPATRSTSAVISLSPHLTLQSDMYAPHLLPHEETSNPADVHRQRSASSAGARIMPPELTKPPFPRLSPGPRGAENLPPGDALAIRRTATRSAPPASTRDSSSRPIIPSNLSLELPANTPVRVGQLKATALIFYLIPHLNPSEDGGLDPKWARVQAQYASDNQKDSIRLLPPDWRNRAGKNVSGEHFGFVEQKATAVVGPMLGRNVIRIKTRVRRGHREVSKCPQDFNTCNHLLTRHLLFLLS